MCAVCLSECVRSGGSCVHTGAAVLCFSIEVLSDGQQETESDESFSGRGGERRGATYVTVLDV